MDEDSASTHFNVARLLYKRHDYGRALAELRLSQQDGEEAPQRLLYLGLASAHLGQWQSAADALGGAVRDNPRNEEAWYWLGSAEVQLHRFSDARAALQRALELNPSDGDAHRSLALAKLELNDVQGAYEQWVAAVRANPRDAQSAYSIGRLFYDARRLREAEQWLDRALHDDPSDYRPSYYLGLCEEALGHTANALALYRASVKASLAAHRPYGWGYAGLGKLLLKSGELDQAQSVLEEGARLAPMGRVLSELGQLRLKQQRNAEAEQALRAAITDDPTLPEPHYLLGRLLAMTARKQEADAEFSRFKQLDAAATAQHRELNVVEAGALPAH